MTFDDLRECPNNAPVFCADGAFGLLIRWYEDTQSAGIQVPGEDGIRDVPARRLYDAGNGALVERDDQPRA